MPESDIVIAAVPPPPISGGTLAIAKDGKTAVAADPDRDKVYIVDLEGAQLKTTIALNAGDEPGRVAIDGSGRAHVALRSGGAVATIDIGAGKLVERRAVCTTPRGVAYDALNDQIHVACSGGELVTLPAAGGAATRSLKLDRDLRDVIVSGDKLLVTRFRTAEVLVVGVDGKIWQRESPRTAVGFDPNTGGERVFEPAVAWRMVSKPGGGAMIVHQRGVSTPVVTTQPGGYEGGGPCDDGIVQTTVTEVGEDGATPIVIPTNPSGSIPGTAMPVDMAVSADGSEITVIAAGTNRVIRTTMFDIANTVPGDCQPPPEPEPLPTPDDQPTAAAYYGTGHQLAVQTREPASLILVNTGTKIVLSSESRKDTGHDIFHKSPNLTGSLACASCHPEAMDDHRTWNFESIGVRRTQSIRGGILATAPLHWDGDMEDMGHIMSEVFVNRMGGAPQGPRRSRLVGRWVDSLPLLPKTDAVDTSAVERGRTIFEADAKAACSTCHSGAKLTNNKNADVGTGKEFQVPTLMGIVERAPFMHDGCAKTLKERFTNPACGGGDKHGVTSHLSEQQIDDLVAFLETL